MGGLFPVSEATRGRCIYGGSKPLWPPVRLAIASLHGAWYSAYYRYKLRLDNGESAGYYAEIEVVMLDGANPASNSGLLVPDVAPSSHMAAVPP